MQPIGVLQEGERILLFYRSAPKSKEICVAVSEDGYAFTPQERTLALAPKSKTTLPFHHVRASRIGRTYVLVTPLGTGRSAGLHFFTHAPVRLRRTVRGSAPRNLVRKEATAVKPWSFTGGDSLRFAEVGRLRGVRELGAVAAETKTKKSRYALYFGGKSIGLATSEDLKEWKVHDAPALSPRKDRFDGGPFTVLGAFGTKEGILVVYASRAEEGRGRREALGAAFFDKEDPGTPIARSEYPLWEEAQGEKRGAFTPLGAVLLHGRVTVYWSTAGGEIFAVASPKIDQPALLEDRRASVALGKARENPIIRPYVGHPWESRAAFNPAALRAEGKVHLLYRAVGEDDVSVLGYAATRDGVHIDERLENPAYVPREKFEGVRRKIANSPPSYAGPYSSGGGIMGGCEDPRLTQIGERVYMTYVAYDGWSGPRVALTSIPLQDFLAHRWNWERPVLISPPGVIDKNACILPEKVKGKYVIFHRVFPNIQIDFVDDLQFDGKTKWLKPRGDFEIKPRPSFWDSRKIGVGPTPLKTEKGWLTIYQGVGEQDPSRYKMGAMLLALDDPRRVLYRSRRPILEPVDWYENEGHKWGVVYPCGAAVVDGRLFVYYGGADTVVCVASAPLQGFLEKLSRDEEPTLEPVQCAVPSLQYAP